MPPTGSMHALFIWVLQHCNVQDWALSEENLVSKNKILCFIQNRCFKFERGSRVRNAQVPLPQKKRSFMCLREETSFLRRYLLEHMFAVSKNKILCFTHDRCLCVCKLPEQNGRTGGLDSEMLSPTILFLNSTLPLQFCQFLNPGHLRRSGILLPDATT